MQLNTKRKPIKLIESIFDCIYLSTVLVSAVLLYISSNIGSERWQFGLMALILGVGDAFHLVPRVYAMWDSKRGNHTAILGIGRQITSITMTIFYIVLWGIGANRYADVVTVPMTIVVCTLAALRIVLCLLPQNRWMSEKSPLIWGILRNVPFFALGILVMLLFGTGSRTSGGFSFLWLAVLISFVCYLPVVLFAHRTPKVGMLMLPKSCAYAAIILMGFSLSGV